MYTNTQIHTYTHTHTHTSEKVFNIHNFTYRVIMNCNLVCYFLQKVETNCIQPELPSTRNVKILACFIISFIISKTIRLAGKAQHQNGRFMFFYKSFQISATRNVQDVKADMCATKQAVVCANFKPLLSDSNQNWENKLYCNSPTSKVIDIGTVVLCQTATTKGEILRIFLFECALAHR